MAHPRFIAFIKSESCKTAKRSYHSILFIRKRADDRCVLLLILPAPLGTSKCVVLVEFGRKGQHVQCLMGGTSCQGLTDWFLVSESVGVGEKLFLVAGGVFSVWCIPGTSGPRTCDCHVKNGSRFFCVGTTLCVNRRSLRQQHVCDVLCCARWSDAILNQ